MARWQLPAALDQLNALASRLDRHRAVTRVAVATAILVVIAPVAIFMVDPWPTRVGGDPWNYLAAGERLNAGHDLYALQPGDRPVPLSPPYWSVPLLSPPFVAVLWRPLAMFGEASMLLWWLGGLASVGVYMVVVLRRASTVGLMVLLLLSPALVQTALSGNASAYLVPILALRHPAAVALAAAIKVFPILIAPSVGLARTLLAVASLGLVSLIGAGVDNHLQWIASVPTSAATPHSLAGLTGLPTGVIAALMVPVSFLGFRAGLVAATLATPVVYFSTTALLSAGLLSPNSLQPPTRTR